MHYGFQFGESIPVAAENRVPDKQWVAQYVRPGPPDLARPGYRKLPSVDGYPIIFSGPAVGAKSAANLDCGNADLLQKAKIADNGDDRGYEKQYWIAVILWEHWKT